MANSPQFGDLLASNFTVKGYRYVFTLCSIKKQKIEHFFSVSSHFIYIAPIKRQNAHVKRKNENKTQKLIYGSHMLQSQNSKQLNYRKPICDMVRPKLKFIMCLLYMYDT